MAIEEFFGDGAGNAVALPVENTWVNGQPFDLRIADPCDLFCRGNVSVLLATNIEVRAQMRDRTSVLAGDWLVIPMPLDGGSYIEWTDWVNRVSGALAQDSPFLFHVPGGYGGPQTGEVGHDVRLQARRIGGGATTAFYVEGERRYNRDSPSMLSQLAGAAGAGAGQAGAEFQLRAATLLTGAFQYSGIFNSGNHNVLEVYVTKTTVNNPTDVYFVLEAADAAGAWFQTDNTYAVAAGDNFNAAYAIRRTDIGAGNPERHLVTFELNPQTGYRVGARFVGGAAPTLAMNGRIIKR
jgi:hypothetical protein